MLYEGSTNPILLFNCFNHSIVLYDVEIMVLHRLIHTLIQRKKCVITKMFVQMRTEISHVEHIDIAVTSCTIVW
jgi:hypothetical protein